MQPTHPLHRIARRGLSLGWKAVTGAAFGLGIVVSLYFARAFVEPGTSPGTAGNQSTGAAGYVLDQSTNALSHPSGWNCNMQTASVPGVISTISATASCLSTSERAIAGGCWGSPNNQSTITLASFPTFSGGYWGWTCRIYNSALTPTANAYVECCS